MPYFDYNATTPMHPAALMAWQETVAEVWHNPSSPYRAAARAHVMLEEAREQLAALIGGQSEQYVFTSGATEANNAVFAHFAKTSSANSHVVVTSIEHPSVVEAANEWFPGRVILLEANRDGVAQIDSLPTHLHEKKIAVVSLLAANNETGVLQPWAEVAQICRANGIPFHCDATQWLGKLPPGNLANCNYVTGSAHKFGGPKGAGFLKINHAAFHAQRGGQQEHGHRAGTENLPAIRGLVAALAALAPQIEKQIAGWERQRAEFESALSLALPGTIILGVNSARLWNTVMFAPPRHSNTHWVTALDRLGFQVSTGSACATGKAGPSHVLAAMGIAPEAVRRAIRVSSGWGTTTTDWQALLAAIKSAGNKLDVENTKTIDLG